MIEPEQHKHRLQRRVHDITGLCQKDEDSIVQHMGIQQLATLGQSRVPINEQNLNVLSYQGPS